MPRQLRLLHRPHSSYLHQSFPLHVLDHHSLNPVRVPETLSRDVCSRNPLQLSGDQLSRQCIRLVVQSNHLILEKGLHYNRDYHILIRDWRRSRGVNLLREPMSNETKSTSESRAEQKFRLHWYDILFLSSTSPTLATYCIFLLRLSIFLYTAFNSMTRLTNTYHE